MKWNKISEKTPNNGERVLVWDGYYNQAQILCWNNPNKLWDDESGDDLHSRSLKRFFYWRPIPELEIE